MSSLIHDPMPKHVYDVGPTVDPAAMVSSDIPHEFSSDYNSEPSLGYAHLEFPDSHIGITTQSVLLGRDDSILKFEREYANQLRIDSEYDVPNRTLPTGDRNGELLDELDEENDSFDEIVQKHTAQGGAVRSCHYAPNRDGKDEPRVYLHPPADPETGLSRIKQISKDHMRIFWSPKESAWMLHVLGRNGAWLNSGASETYLKKSSQMRLDNGDTVQIAGLLFTFHRPEEDEDSEDSEEDEGYSSVEDFPRRIVRRASSVGLRSDSDGDIAVEDAKDEDSEEEEDDDEDEANNQKIRPSSIAKTSPKIKLKTSSKSLPKSKAKGKDKPKEEEKELTDGKDAKAQSGTPRSTSNRKKTDFNVKEYLAPGEEFVQRRGPGRPPANGVMSLREMRERKRKLAIENGEDPSKGRSLGHKARKISAAGEDGDRSEARKSKKRKRDDVNGDGSIDARDSPDGDDADDDDKDDKHKAKAPTPEPVPKEEDFTEEQKKKPEGTTQERLYIILQEATEPMPLPKIYRAIRDKWPWFWFTETSGWESSVRHTLSQHACFRAVGREGKGQLWELDRSIQLERKPRASQATVSRPPPQSIPNGVANPSRPGIPNGTGYHQPQYQGRYMPPQPMSNNGQRPAVPPNQGHPTYHPPYMSGGFNPPSRPAGQYLQNTNQASNFSQPSRQPLNGHGSPNSIHATPQAPQPPPNRSSPLPNGTGSRPHSTAPSNNQANGAVPSKPGRADISNMNLRGSALEAVRQGQIPPLLVRFKASMRATSDPARSEVTAQEVDRATQWVLQHATQRDAMPPPQTAKAELVVIIWDLLIGDVVGRNKNATSGAQASRPQSSSSQPGTSNGPAQNNPSTQPINGVGTTPPVSKSPAVPSNGETVPLAEQTQQAGTAVQLPDATTPLPQSKGPMAASGAVTSPAVDQKTEATRNSEVPNVTGQSS